MPLGVAQLGDRQAELLAEWLPAGQVTRDHSWGLVGTVVLEISERNGSRYIVKAGNETDRHISRELTAHHWWLTPWTSLGRAPQLVHADGEAKILATRYLPGRLVQDSAHESAPDIYRQAGELLAMLHGQLSVNDDGQFEARQKERTLAWLDGPQRIGRADTIRLREIVEAWPTPRAVLVPTHGDWQPRN